MEFNDLELERLKKLERLRERGIEPYPARVTRTHTNQQVDRRVCGEAKPRE